MVPRIALVLVALGLSACGSSGAATQYFQSSAGYRLSYPAGWNARSTSSGAFSASAADGREYLTVMRVVGSPGQVLAAHRSELSRVSDHVMSREVQVPSGSVSELWSSRVETDGQVGIYQQYFLAAGGGTLWVQHGCVEHGPEFANESADRDCDDAGAAIVRSVDLT